MSPSAPSSGPGSASVRAERRVRRTSIACMRALSHTRAVPAFSAACERNRGPILEVLTRVLASSRSVLEIGSGTGQHAVHFAAALPHLSWQPTELGCQLAPLAERIRLEGTPNLRAPVALDVHEHPWPVAPVDAVFEIRDAIRTIPDYPKPGVMFRDITTLLGNARVFRSVVDLLVEPWLGRRIDRVAGIEARGFILGGAIAHQLSAGFVPIRKKGKLPHTTVRVAYSLEYGLDEMEMHRDAVVSGERIILVDDLIATGGTAEAAVKLLHTLGAEILAACFIVDLPDLGGSARLEALKVPARTLVAFR